MELHHYTAQEKADAEKVDKAVAWVHGGNVREGQALLEEVALNTPEFYVYNFGDDRKQYIKFWSMAEYLGYIAMTRNRGEVVEQEVMWLLSAYPRALYELAMIDISNDNDAGAAEYLDRALQLEPDHPECLLRMAEVYARTGDLESAIEHFDSALGSRPYMSSQTIANALGGKARVLIDMDDLVEAEKCLDESLRHGPGNKLAVNLQRYIQSMKAGNVTAPVEMDGIATTTPPPPEDAPPSEEAPPPPQVADDDEPVGDVMDEPAPRARKKRWWQFGKGR